MAKAKTPAVIQATIQGDADAVASLLAAGADPNSRAGALVDVADEHGNTPLFRAVFESKGRGEMVKLLLSRGAGPDLCNAHGVSPRIVADTIANFDVKQFFSS